MFHMDRKYRLETGVSRLGHQDNRVGHHVWAGQGFFFFFGIAVGGEGGEFLSFSFYAYMLICGDGARIHLLYVYNNIRVFVFILVIFIIIFHATSTKSSSVGNYPILTTEQFFLIRIQKFLYMYLS